MFFIFSVLVSLHVHACISERLQKAWLKNCVKEITVHYYVEVDFCSALFNINLLSVHKLGFLPAVLCAELCILWFTSEQKNLDFLFKTGTHFEQESSF